MLHNYSINTVCRFTFLSYF